MAEITASDILEATDGHQLLKGDETAFSGVSIDSRTIGDGEVFFAIQGDSFDGHDYVEKALIKGGGAVVQKELPTFPEGKTVIVVTDTLRSLQDLAHFLRMKRDIPLVAVTGSNGKTTTKEMIYQILSVRFQTLKNEGNLNNHVGLPLSLVHLSPDDEMVVLEMGMNAAGEIARLREIAAPTHGVITNIGSAHVGRLGSHEAVRSAKLELIEGLHTAVVNADDRFLMEGFRLLQDYKGQVMTFGIRNRADVMARTIETTDSGSRFVLDIAGQAGIELNLHVHGRFNIYNALAASAVAHSLGLTMGEIKEALEAHRSCPMRFEISVKKGITVINDSYNANPTSIRQSLLELVAMAGEGRTVAVLGDMKELGSFSDAEHRDTGQVIAEAGIDLFIAVGEKMALAAESSMNTPAWRKTLEVAAFRDAAEAGARIMDYLKDGDMVLVKGSRSMKMETIVEAIG